MAVKWLLIVWWLYALRAVAEDAQIRLYTGVNRSRLFVPNHGFVRHDQIDDYYPAKPRQIFLACITPFENCCSHNFTIGGKEIGWWFFPNGTEIPKIESLLQWGFYTSRHRRIVFLYRRGESASGIHRCDIPVSVDANETVYVGLYPNEDSANLIMTSIQFNLVSEYSVTEMPEFTLTCISEGGPATTVNWTRDGEALSEDNFTVARRLDNPETATYTLTLSVVGRQGGVYRCQVAKGGPGVSGYPVNSSMELKVKAANPPAGLTALQESETTISISWIPPTAGDVVTGYLIFYQPNNSVLVDASVTHYTIIDLEPTITYSITIIALSEHLPSELAGPITPDLVPPKEPVLEGPNTVEELETLQLKCNFSGYPAPSITWLKRDREELKSILSSQRIAFQSSIVTNLTTSTLLIYNVTVADSGEYICEGNFNGIHDTGPSLITIKSITINAKNECIVDENINTPCQHDSLCIDLLGGYECVCTGNYTGSNCTSLVEQPDQLRSPSITSPPEQVLLGLVEPVNLTCEAEGHPTPLYEWYRDDELIPGAALPYLYIPAASPEDRGYYTCKAINTQGVAESTPELLTIPGIFQFTATIGFPEFDSSDIIEQTMLTLVGSFLGNSNASIYSAKLLTTSSANETTILITVVSEDRTSASVVMYIEEEFRSFSTVQLMQISRFDGCPAENTSACAFYSWPETEIGTAVYRPCPSADPRAQVKRVCKGTFTDGATWSEITPAENTSSVAQCVCQLCPPTPGDIALCTAESTASPEDLSAGDISAVAYNIHLLTDEAIGNSEIRNSYLQIIDNLQRANDSVILESQMESQSSTRILDSLGKFLDELQISPNESTNMEIFSQRNYALQVQDIDREVFQGETFNVDLGSVEEAINNTGNIDQDALVTMMETLRYATGSIQVPQSVLDVCATAENLRLSYSVFLNYVLFQSPNQTANNLVIGTVVLGIRLRCALNQTLTNVSMPITLSFRTREGLQNATNSSCVSLQTSSGFGGWSRDNCREITNSRSERLCECRQLLAHFGILFDLTPGSGPPLSEAAALALASITYAGLSLSMLCLTILIITYLSSKILRGSTHGQILVNLGIALVGMYIFFLIGGHVTPVPALCGISSALLQYFLLVYFAWMAAEAVFLYLKLVTVLGTRPYEAKFTLKAGLAAWLAPLLIVVISAGAGYKYYANPFYCRATEWPFWFGFFLPFTIVYVLNWIMFLIIMVSICKHTRNTNDDNASVGTKNSIGQIKRDLVVAVSLAITLGLGWGLGLAATSSSMQEATLVFQIIFSIFVGAQGLLIFALHGIRSEEARKVWKAWAIAITRKAHKSYTFIHDSAAHISGVQKRLTIPSSPSTGSYGLSTLGRTDASQEGSGVFNSKADSSVTNDETTFQHVKIGGSKMSQQLSDEATILPNPTAVDGHTEKESQLKAHPAQQGKEQTLAQEEVTGTSDSDAQALAQPEPGRQRKKSWLQSFGKHSNYDIMQESSTTPPVKKSFGPAPDSTDPQGHHQREETTNAQTMTDSPPRAQRPSHRSLSSLISSQPQYQAPNSDDGDGTASAIPAERQKRIRSTSKLLSISDENIATAVDHFGNAQQEA